MRKGKIWKDIARLVKFLDQHYNILWKKKVRSVSSLDPARATQASEDTRDSMFTKLNDNVILMHELKIYEERSYSELKCDAIYNMDECALDITRRSKKVLCSKEELGRLFQITSEGDGKMSIHIALTSRADGELIYEFFPNFNLIMLNIAITYVAEK